MSGVDASTVLSTSQSRWKLGFYKMPVIRKKLLSGISEIRIRRSNSGGRIGHKGADPEDKDEYKAENGFFVPEIARWSYLQSKATLPTIGKVVDNAMDAIEKDNSSLRREAQRGDQREFEEGEIGLNTH